MLRNCSKLMLPAPSCQSGFGGADHQLVERKTPMMMIIVNAITNHSVAKMEKNIVLWHWSVQILNCGLALVELHTNLVGGAEHLLVEIMMDASRSKTNWWMLWCSLIIDHSKHHLVNIMMMLVSRITNRSSNYIVKSIMMLAIAITNQRMTRVPKHITMLVSAINNRIITILSRQAYFFLLAVRKKKPKWSAGGWHASFHCRPWERSRIVNIMMVPVLEATMVLLLVSLACSKLFSTPLMETPKGEIRGAGSPIPKVSFKTAAAQRTNVPRKWQKRKSVVCRKPYFWASHISR